MWLRSSTREGFLRLLASILALVSLCGCETLAYYAQAVGGQVQLMARAQPVAALLADPATPAPLRARLELARSIREFSVRELGLPDNGSYRSYAELGRPFAVWNVVAATEFSLEPVQSCFPVAGCVSYRGFFGREDAERHGAKLRAQGYDVYMYGVPAYSTLGRFDDPLLSSFIRYADAELARLVFHELAHQLVYARGDTTFNESFAVVVEEEGVRRWLEFENRSGELAAFRSAQARKREFAARVAGTRERLAAAYQESLPREAMLERKRVELERLRAAYPGLPADINNAFLASIAVYTELVPAFERLLAKEGSLDAFYERVKKLAKSGKRDIDDLLVRRPGT